MTKPYILGKSERIMRGGSLDEKSLLFLYPALQAGKISISMEASKTGWATNSPMDSVIYRIKHTAPEPRMRLTVYFVNPAFHPMTYDVDGAWVETITDGRLEIKNQAVFAAGHWAYFEIEEIKDGDYGFLNTADRDSIQANKDRS